MMDTRTNSPPDLREEMKRVEAEYGPALAAFEDLIRGHVPDQPFEMFCRLVIESVKTKPADAVNDCLRSVFQQIEFSALPKGLRCNERFLEPIRAYYLNGAKDADREHLKQTLNSLLEYKAFSVLLRGKEPPIPDAASIEQAYRDFVEALRWFKEHAPEIREQYANLREKYKTLKALEVKVRETQQAIGLSKEAESLLERAQTFIKRLERLVKDAYGLERDYNRIRHKIESAPDAAAANDATANDATANDAEKPDAGTKPKPGDKRNNQHFKGRLF